MQTASEAVCLEFDYLSVSIPNGFYRDEPPYIAINSAEEFRYYFGGKDGGVIFDFASVLTNA